MWKIGLQLRRDTANQCFSGVVNTLRSSHKRKKKFNQHENWNTEVRTDVAKLVTRRCIANNTNVKDISKGFGRSTHIRISKSLFSTGTVESIQTRAILNASYHAVGRGGEVGLLTRSNLC